jgi:ion channel-forming bestrophin family protein
MILAANLLLATFVATATAFSSVQRATRTSLTKLSMDNTKQPPTLPPIRDISYGEESRKYRRTIFTHDDWVNFRSPDRFWRNLEAVTSSGIYKNVGKEILATTGVAAFVVLYNGLVGGFQDLSGNTMDPIIQASFLPIIGLPLAPFTLSSPSLGLLLGRHLLMCQNY